MSNDTIAAAIAAAQAGAKEFVQSNQAVATQSTSSAIATTPGAPLGLDDMMGGGVSVDHWLKVTPYGITVGDKTKPLDAIEVFVDMSEIAYSYQVKYTLNGQAKYHRTYDRQTDAAGGTWMETIQKAQQIDPKAYEYRSAELPFTLAEEIDSKEKGVAAAFAGDRLGLTLSTTGWKKFQDFVRDLGRKQIDARSAIVKLTLGFEVKKKPGVNDWGVPTFLNAEEVDIVPHFETVH